jgi:hypothetical protein
MAQAITHFRNEKVAATAIRTLRTGIQQALHPERKSFLAERSFL